MEKFERWWSEERNFWAFWPRLCGYLLLVIGFLTCAGVVCAQTPPYNVQAYVLGPSAVQVEFEACQSNDDCDTFSVYRNPPGFTQPPVKKNLSLGDGFPQDSQWTEWTDTSVKAGTSYTYEVCTRANPNTKWSNCTTTTSPVTPQAVQDLQAAPAVNLSASPNPIPPNTGWKTTLTWNSVRATTLDLEPGVGKVGPSGSKTVPVPADNTTYTITATGPGGTTPASVEVAFEKPCPSFGPPQNLNNPGGYPLFGWTNPITSPNTPDEVCPSSPTDVAVYKQTPSAWQKIADLPANNNILPDRYSDTESLQPHSIYQYMVCEGAMSGQTPSPNCKGVNVLTLGAGPVLYAAPVSTTAVQLQVAVDEAATVTAISVTRGVVDNVCIKGQKLGNGLRGCPTVHFLPNGTFVPGPPVTTCPGGCTAATCPGGMVSPVYAGPMVTVYNWTAAPIINSPSSKTAQKRSSTWTLKSQSAPYVFELSPEDTTVKPGVEYFYQAQVQWSMLDQGLTEDSGLVTLTVPKFFNDLYAQQATLGGGPQPITKLNGEAPPASQLGAKAGLTMAPMVSATSPAGAPASASPMVRPAGMTALSQSATAVTLAIAPIGGGASAGSAGTCPAPSGMAAGSTMAPMVLTPLAAMTAQPSPEPAPANSTILVPDNAFPGGALTGVVIGPDDKPVPNTPVEVAGGVPGTLTGEVTGEQPAPCGPNNPNYPDCQQPQQPQQVPTPTGEAPTPTGAPAKPALPPVNCASLLRQTNTPRSGPTAGAGQVPRAAGAPVPSSPLSAPGGTAIVTDALGRFVICMSPNAPKVSVNLPGGQQTTVTALNGRPRLPDQPPRFFQPSQKIDLNGLVRNATVSQGSHRWLVPAVQAWSPDGTRAITTLQIPHDVEPGPINLSYVGNDNRSHEVQGSVFRIVRAYIDRANLRSNQGAKFGYVVQFTPQGEQKLCVEMHVAGPVVLVKAPSEEIPVNASGLGTFQGRIRATRVMPGAVVPFELTPHFNVCSQ